MDGSGLAIVIAAIITAPPAYVAAWNSIHNRRQLVIPSGGTIGEKVELAHDLTAVNAAGIKVLVENGDALDRAVERINGAPHTPVHVENG